MKFNVNIGELADGLKTAGRAISGKATLPVLSHVLIEAKQHSDGPGYLSVAGTDLEIALRTRVPARVEEPGATTVPARLLQNLMSTWRQEADVRAELDAESQTLGLQSDGASASVKGINANEYPDIKDPSEWDNVGLDAYDFREALDRVVFAAAADGSRPILTGVYMHTEGDGLVLVAADGFRMSTVEMDADIEDVDALERGLIVPAQGLRELARLVPGAGKPVRVAFRPGQPAQVAFVVYDKDGEAQTVLTSQLIDGNFPNYRQIIPKNRALTVTGETWEIQNAVQGAMVFASHAANIVRVYFREGEMMAEGMSSEMGRQEARVDVETEGRMLDETRSGDSGKPGALGAIAVNGAYCLDGLKAVGSAEEVRIEMTTPTSPLTLRRVGDDSFIHILMPMHIGK